MNLIFWVWRMIHVLTQEVSAHDEQQSGLGKLWFQYVLQEIAIGGVTSPNPSHAMISRASAQRVT